ncbi:hypothetical protein [Rossellomorea marisflavi]|uniref:hypothetical protein n=1 Tax=Rossellomorea marisflavi TaxID=189381 RepID=UPI003D2F475D
MVVVRSVALRAAAFHGACGEPPHSCGVSPCALFPQESSTLRYTALCVEEWWVENVIGLIK